MAKAPFSSAKSRSPANAARANVNFLCGVASLPEHFLRSLRSMAQSVSH